MDAYKKAQWLAFFLLIEIVVVAQHIPDEFTHGQLEESSFPSNYTIPLPTEDINIDIDDASTDLTEPIDQEISESAHENADETFALPIDQRTIDRIVVHGNQHIATDAILNKISYKPGQFYDPLRKTEVIRSIFGLQAFSNVTLQVKQQDDDRVLIHIYVDEKPLLKEMRFEGNKNLTVTEITKKGFDPKDIQFIDQFDLEKYKKVLEKLYREKNYHQVKIDPILIDEDGKLVAIFMIQEGKQSIVKQVFFKGNKTFSEKMLRSKIFTREDWVLSFMDKAGSYHPDAIESDKHTLEDFYQSNGFLNAKVTNVDIQPIEGTNFINITFNIHEGDLYQISELSVQGNDIITEKDLLRQIPIAIGQYYSKERIRQTIEFLRLLWGQHGYIDADIIPSIEPNDDTKTVKLAFFTELGNKAYVNRINIVGNTKTRDKIIRRQLNFEEGDLLTLANMEESKNRVEGLGYFEQKEGVNWKIKRKNQEAVDVDLFVREVKTGRFDFQLGFGGSQKDIQNPMKSLKIGGTISDTNLLGLGIALNLTGEFSKQEKQLLFNLTEPWLFDKPIYAALDASFKRTLYDDIKLTSRDIKEEAKSGSISLGWIAESLNCTKFYSSVGIEGIHYGKKPPMPKIADFKDQKTFDEFQAILNNRFQAGNIPWLGFTAGQDFRNHPLHPSRGYQWLFQSKLGIPFDDFGFWKFDFDASYYTPIIGERDLVFWLHGHLGIITAFQGKTIPFRELYNIGGPATVRGFFFGEIGPTYQINPNIPGDPLGSTRALWLNAELVFPITQDFSIKGAVFYDGGAGWATPDADEISKKRLKNNGFSYRHAVGFGVRILQPTPVKIDWGFKLDKKKGEKESEVHFTMSRAF